MVARKNVFSWWCVENLQLKVLVAVWGHLKCILLNLCLNSGQLNPHLLWCYIAQVHYVLVANWDWQVCIQLLSRGTFFWSKPRSGRLSLIFLYWFSLKLLTYCDLIPQIKPMVKPTRIIIGLHNIQYRWHDLISKSMYSYLLWLHLLSCYLQLLLWRFLCNFIKLTCFPTSYIAQRICWSRLMSLVLKPMFQFCYCIGFGEKNLLTKMVLSETIVRAGTVLMLTLKYLWSDR